MSVSQKDLFLLDDDVTYLNCANMSPLLKAGREAALTGLDMRAAPWNLSGEDWFSNSEKLRSLAAKVFQTDNDNVCIIPSASYGLAVAAKNLKIPAGKEIIILEKQFPSNFYVWENMAKEKNLKIVAIKKSKGKTLTESILEKINNNTGIVSIPNCHWIDGTSIDLQQISDAAKRVGSYFVLDLSQSLGVLPIDIESIQPDFAVSVGYKWMLGPYGIGYMYVSKKWQDEGEPLEYSWITKKGSEDFADLTNYVEGYRKGARKFDMGEFPQFHLLPIAIAGLEQILQWKIPFIQTEIKQLTDKIVAYKKNRSCYESNLVNVGHIVSIPFDSSNLNLLKNKLKGNKVNISFRGSLIRVSPHLYNSMEQVDKLLNCFDD